MNYIKIRNADIADGPGIRVAAYVSGCRNHCPGCHNPDSWSFAAGNPWTERERESVLAELGKPYVAGLSILGGEPFEEENQKDLADLAEEAKRRFPQKSVWVWTGYEMADLLEGGKKRTEHSSRFLRNADCVVAGPYVASERDVSAENLWRGSRNQRVFLGRKSEESGAPELAPGFPNND